jgi:hypothetical protein
MRPPAKPLRENLGFYAKRKPVAGGMHGTGPTRLKRPRIDDFRGGYNTTGLAACLVPAGKRGRCLNI